MQTYKIRIPRKPKFVMPAPIRPQLVSDESERMTGMVKGIKASEPEERFAQALDRAGKAYVFRYVFGAPKYAPGWKEMDFVIIDGLVYLVEIDTVFTHRSKGSSDILHDTLALTDQSFKQFGEVYPSVIRVDGDFDLADKQSADRFVRRSF